MTDSDWIHLRGVCVHNLKGVDVNVPLRRLTVISGISGSGKSSLAFDTLYAEAQRRYLQSFSTYTRQFLERLDRPDAEHIGNLPPAIAVSQRALPRGLRSTVGTLTEVGDYLRLLFARGGTVFCRQCGQEMRASSAADVHAAVERMPPGTQVTVAFPSRPESSAEAAVWAAGLQEEGFVRVLIGDVPLRLGEGDLPSIPEQSPVWVLVDRLEVGRLTRERLIDSIETAFARGGGRMALLAAGEATVFDQRPVCPSCGIEFASLEPRLFSFNDPLGACPACEGTGNAAGPARVAGHSPCPTCQGKRLNELALSVRVGGRNFAELSALSIEDLAGFCATLEMAKRQAGVAVVLEQTRTRLGYLKAVDLDYLSLDRSARTLSTGELQRVRLTTALASNLVNALYVLDEPTAGLHPRDTARLLAVLLRLRDAGNTLAVVEHDFAILRAADHLVDLGPGAGEEGGRLLYQGPPAGVGDAAGSVTGDYLAGRRQIAVPIQRRAGHGSLRVIGARANNLKDLTVEIPLGVLCVVTGVSGAGKSTLVEETMYPALAQRKHRKTAAGTNLAVAQVLGGEQIGDVVLMNQTPLPRTQRSNPVTYLKVFDDIRKVFADTPEARLRSFGPGVFSFNQPGGRCETCQGQGTITVDMQFLADVTVLCPDCQGSRYKRDLLTVKVRGLHIAEVLDLTVREAFRFFRAQPLIQRRLKLLLDVGLEYLRLGQAADTLSGGECQRLKLAGHLAGARKPRCLFLLDEPTAGLHVADIARLLVCFERLLATGHSLVVVEHNLDLIKCADHVIDLGPGAGGAGGSVVAAGTPEEVAGVAESFTGQWLRQVLPALHGNAN